MMDEQLIDEVAQHGVIYNRQKYYLNGSGGGGGGSVPKYETKDEAWHIIAIKMHSDVDTCKKRWKYLRERYVSQRKQGDPPVYEHLSRPYLEKMKFLDQHIQPRKSYRNVPNFLTSPHSANSSGYSEYNMDSKSNGSMKNMNHFVAQHHYQDQHAMNALSSAAAAASALENAGVTNSHVKLEADQVFRDFAAAVASQQLQHISQSQQMQHHHQQQQQQTAAIADSSQGYQEHYRDTSTNVNALNGQNCLQNGTSNGVLTSSTSPLKSPLSSPLAMNAANTNNTQTNTPQQSTNSAQMNTNAGFSDVNTDDLDSSVSSNYNVKKPRVQLNSHGASSSNLTQHNVNANNHANSQYTDDTDDDSDDNSINMLQQVKSVAALQRNSNHHQHHQQQPQQQQQNVFPPNADFLFQLYQQLPHNQNTTQQQHFNKFQAPQTALTSNATTHQQQQRCSEALLGELVTTELLKMSKERRKTVQRRILEILFFED